MTAARSIYDPAWDPAAADPAHVTVVSRAEFFADPARWVRLAVGDRSVVVVEHGRVRMAIHGGASPLIGADA